MSIALVGLGPLLAFVAIVLSRRGGRRPVAGLILAAVPLALVGFAASIVTGTYAFTTGFRKMAEQGAGGAASVAEPCLAISGHLAVGAGAVLVTLLIVGGVAALHRRDAGLPEEEKASGTLTAGRGAALVALSVLPVAGLGALAVVAERLARLTMLAVDPSRQDEAQAALGNMNVAEFSSFLAVNATVAQVGGVAIALLLVVAGPVAALVVRPGERNGVVRAYAWISLAVIGLLMGWHLMVARALTSWFTSVQGGA